MPEIVYPISCRSCSKSLYGPVKYCPYCGVAVETASTEEHPDEPENIGQGREHSSRMDSPGSASKVPSPQLQFKTTPKKVSEDTAKIDSEDTVSKEEPAPAEKAGRQKDGFDPAVSVDSKQSTIKKNKDRDKARLPWKRAAVAILLLFVIVVYFIFRDKGPHTKGPNPPATSETTVRETGGGTGSTKVDSPTVPTTPPTTFAPTSTIKDGRNEAARILALEALRQGTNLSVMICNLPKFEKVLQAAQQLYAINPRYKDQVASAERTISNTRNARDQSMMAYLNKVLELGRYTSEQVSYAMDTIKNGDPTPREKIVAELLAGHVNDLRNNPKPDPAKMLSNFTQRFTNFVD